MHKLLLQNSTPVYLLSNDLDCVKSNSMPKNDMTCLRDLIKVSYPIICVGLIGCFMTSITGVTAVMLFRGWTEQGGWIEWSKRIAIGYPASTLVVFLVFPWMVPKLTKYFAQSVDRSKR